MTFWFSSVLKGLTITVIIPAEQHNIRVALILGTSGNHLKNCKCIQNIHTFVPLKFMEVSASGTMSQSLLS